MEISESIKTVVITGSSRGLGFEIANQFIKKGWNVVINGINEEHIKLALEKLKNQKNKGSVESFLGNISSEKDIKGLINFTIEKFKNIDIWINNAGINQPMKALWELTEKEIDKILNVNLKGTIFGTRLATLQMEKQLNGGYIYNMEGFGNDDSMMLGLNLYGTSKRAVTYFTQAYAKELEEKKSKVKIGRLSPGIVITDFITKALGGEEEIKLTDKVKNIYNILGDYPDVIAEFLVNNILNTKINNVKIEWLTKSKAAWRFMLSGFNKRNFFK